MNISVSSKEEIIAYCKEIVQEKDIQAISIRSVAEKCGISVGAVYNYFPSKKELLAATIGSIWADIFHRSEESFEFNDFIDCLVALFKSIEAGKKLYPNFFTNHSLVMAFDEKNMSEKMMVNFWSHIKESLVEILAKDSKVRKDVFNHQLTAERFVDYIFELFLYTLIDENNEYEGLLQLVRNAIY
ncbi:TetR/AcrR family transcriptional regulator [Enterococcus sp. LJL99]